MLFATENLLKLHWSDKLSLLRDLIFLALLDCISFPAIESMTNFIP